MTYTFYLQRWNCGCGHEWEQLPRTVPLGNGRRMVIEGSAQCPKCKLTERSELTKQHGEWLDGQLAVWSEEPVT